MYIINRKHHGKCFVQFLFTRIIKFTRSQRLARSWIKTVRAHFPWSSLYVFPQILSWRRDAYWKEKAKKSARSSATEAAHSAVPAAVMKSLSASRCVLRHPNHCAPLIAIRSSRNSWELTKNANASEPSAKRASKVRTWWPVQNSPRCSQTDLRYSKTRKQLQGLVKLSHVR